MNRNFTITHPNHQINATQGISIDINNLDKIINHSADTVYCGCLEFVPSEQLENLINVLLTKIKPKGTITFSIKNIKEYCRMFLDNILSGTEFLKSIENLKNIVCIEDIYTKIDTNIFTISQILIDQQTINITIERVNI
jgi:hypothetical protein